MIASISWRNLWRNKLRSLIIISAVSVGIVGGILSDGFMEGMMDQRVNAAIANEISNIQLHNPKFLLNNEINYTIQNPEQYIDGAEKLPQIAGVSKRIICGAMASTANAATAVLISGVVPEQEKKVTKISEKLIAGEYLRQDQRIPVVIGKPLAKKLGLGLNNKLIVTLADSSGTITYGAFLVVGIYETSNALFDEAHVFVRYNDLGALAGIVGQVHEIAISLKNNEETTTVFQQLSNTYSAQVQAGDIDIQPWQKLEPLLQSMIEMMSFFSYMFLIIILIALAFAIINTMTMAIMERKQEIGMLMAIGMTRGKVFSMIMLETLFLSIVGGLAGLVISYGLVAYFSRFGLDLGSMAGGMDYIGYDSVVFFKVTDVFYFTSFVLVAITAVLSSISPSIKALKLNPVEAIRDIN
jgi:ABC-type lipoprotein release transport system permease subunit